MREAEIEEFFRSIDTTGLSDSEVAIRALRMQLDGRLYSTGGYPAAIDSGTCPAIVAVADSDDDGGVGVTIYSRKRLDRMGRKIRRESARLMAEYDDEEIDLFDVYWEFDFRSCEYRSKSNRKEATAC